MESNNGEAKIQKVKNWSPVWIFPIVTALIGAWVLFYHYSHQGPEVTLITANAEGIEGARHSRREGGLFQGAAPKAGRIAGDGQTTDSRKSFLCAACGRDDSGRRGYPAYCWRGFGIRA